MACAAQARPGIRCTPLGGLVARHVCSWNQKTSSCPTRRYVFFVEQEDMSSCFTGMIFFSVEQEDTFSCGTGRHAARRHVFLLHKKTRFPGEQEDQSSCETRRHVFGQQEDISSLLNKRAFLLPREGKTFSVVEQGDTSACKSNTEICLLQ